MIASTFTENYVGPIDTSITPEMVPFLVILAISIFLVFRALLKNGTKQIERLPNKSHKRRIYRK